MNDFFKLAMETFEEIRKYFVNSAGEPNLLGKLIRTFIIIISTRLLISLTHSLIDKAGGPKDERVTLSSRRAETIRNTMKNIIKVLFYFYGTLMILELFKIDTKSILATAGIGGIAIGFGAQSLVKDVITGFFILQENIYVVGDYVRIRGYEGSVEELGLRVTKIRDLTGDLHIIPNGEVHIISNLSRGAVRAMVFASIAYEEDLDRSMKALQKVCDKINMEYENYIVKDIYIRGVERLTDVGIDIRIEGMVRDMMHWDVERALRKEIKDTLERENIEIPYPRLVIYGGDEE